MSSLITPELGYCIVSFDYFHSHVIIIILKKKPYFSSFAGYLYVGHIEWHLEVGLAMQFIEAPLQVQQRNTIPQGMYDSCKTLGQLSSGNAAGNQNDPLNLKGLPQGPFEQTLGWLPKGIGAMAG